MTKTYARFIAFRIFLIKSICRFLIPPICGRSIIFNADFGLITNRDNLDSDCKDLIKSILDKEAKNNIPEAQA